MNDAHNAENAPWPIAAMRVSRSEDETERIGKAIGGSLRGGDLVALEGHLGAGKTRLVRGIAAGLGLSADEVSSPTYVLVQEYGPSPAGLTLAHADAYRLDGSASLESVGWDEFAGEADVVTIVEWASRIADAMPPNTVWIDITSERALDDAPDVAPDVVATATGGPADGPGTGRRIEVRCGESPSAGDAVARIAIALGGEFR